MLNMLCIMIFLLNQDSAIIDSKCSVVLTLLACVWKAPCSNLGRDSNHNNWYFIWFSSDKFRHKTLNQPKVISSTYTYSPIHHIHHPLDTTCIFSYEQHWLISWRWIEMKPRNTATTVTVMEPLLADMGPTASVAESCVCAYFTRLQARLAVLTARPCPWTGGLANGLLNKNSAKQMLIIS
jgi:hypothetical protein